MPTIPSFRQPKIRLLIGRPDGTTWVDVSEYVSRISWQTGDVQMIGTGNTGVDGVARSLEFVLRNGEHSFSPKARTSPWNQLDGQYAPLLDANREVVLHVSDDGGNTWRTEFHGYLGERIISRASEVECFATDLSKPLRQKFITEARQYGSAEGTPVEDVIQQILDDYMGPGAYQLYCPVPTQSVIVNQPEPWTVEYMSVWDAIQKAATEIGWWLGFRWDHASQLYRLTLLEPPTNKTTADFELDWEDDFYNEEEEITDQYVRNNITVYYRDEAGNRHSVNVRDEGSIAKFGEISMIIEEQNADFIRTEEAALRLANSALHSLAWMTGHIRLDMPYLPGLDVFSTIRIRRRNPKISSDQDFYAVHSVRVVFDFQAGRFRCECLASGRVITGHARWRRMETRPGSPGMPQDPKPPTLGQPGTPTGLTGDFSGLDAVFRWNRAPYKHWEQDKVEVYINGVLRRTTFTKANEFVYTLDMNRHDNGGAPSPQVEIRVYHVYTTGALSPPAIISVSHPLPPKPTIVLSSSNAQIRWQVTSPAPIGWESTSVQIGDYYAIVADMSGVVDATQAGVGDGQIAQVSIAVRNVFGQQSEPAISTITANYLDKSAFAANIRPVELVSSLPQLPNPQYPQGSVVFLTTDNKLYRSTGNSWTAAVPTTDLSGTITETQIANDAVTTPKLKAGAVTTDKLAAGAVTADKLAANSVTAGKIAAGAVKADAIDANAVGIRHLIVGDPARRAVENVNASHLPNALPEGGVLFHFDHSLLSTRGLRPLPGSVATLCPGEGRFGGAVAVEEGTTNKIATEGGAAQDWSKWSHWGNRMYWQSETQYDDPVMGKVFQGTATDTTYMFNYYPYAFTSGVQYTLSVYLKADRVITKNLSFYLVSNVGGQHTIASTTVSATITTKWQRFSAVLTPSETTAAGQGGIGIRFGPGNEGVVYYAARPQLEQKPFATSFVDGTRAAGVLTYDASIMPVQSATVAAWVWVPPSSHWPTTKWRRIISNANNFTARTIALYLLPADRKLYLEISDDSNTRQTISSPSSIAQGWHHVVATWDASRMALYVDGSLVAQKPSPSLPTSHPYSWIAVGSRTDNMDHLNGLLDELLILPYAASPEEIRAWYELGAPFYDAAEITVGGRGAVVINDEGAFGYDAQGVKQAGFTTSGKWVAGGRPDGTFAVEADKSGLRITGYTQSGHLEDRLVADTDGNLMVAGELRPTILILPIRQA